MFFQTFFDGGGGIPASKKTYDSPPQNSCQIMCSKSFSAGTVNYKYITETHLMDSKHRKLFALSNQKGAHFAKNAQNTFGGRPPQWGYLLAKGGKEGEGERGLLKGVSE